MSPGPRYRFLTTWVIESPREPVWRAIWDSERWPEWWRGVVEATELDPGDANGIGRSGRYRWRARLPYELAFVSRTTRVEPPRFLEAEATGELIGIGRWRLFEDGGLTAVLYEWNVSTSKRWMNLLGPIARPVFDWNHDWLMRNGGKGLARLLDAPLLVAA